MQRMRKILSDTTQPNVTSNKGFIIQHAKLLCLFGRIAQIFIYGECVTEVPSGTKLAQEIQLNNWSTTGEQGKLVLVVSTKPSLAQFISLFTTGKNHLSLVQITLQFKFFTLRFLLRKHVKKFVFTNKIFCRRFLVARNPFNRSSGV